jgi:hypothetical protein
VSDTERPLRRERRPELRRVRSPLVRRRVPPGSAVEEAVADVARQRRGGGGAGSPGCRPARCADLSRRRRSRRPPSRRARCAAYARGSPRPAAPWARRGSRRARSGKRLRCQGVLRPGRADPGRRRVGSVHPATSSCTVSGGSSRPRPTTSSCTVSGGSSRPRTMAQDGQSYPVGSWLGSELTQRAAAASRPARRPSSGDREESGSGSRAAAGRAGRSRRALSRPTAARPTRPPRRRSR